MRKDDIGTAKNHLKENETEELNRIVTMYLDYAEDQAKKRNTITMDKWADRQDTFLVFNERNLLTHVGKFKMELAHKLAAKRYDKFDAKRKEAEAFAADEDDIKELESLEKKIKKHVSAKMRNTALAGLMDSAPLAISTQQVQFKIAYIQNLKIAYFFKSPLAKDSNKNDSHS